MTKTSPTKGYNTRSSSRRQQTRGEHKPQGLYPGINDFADALEALPLETVRHFTLLREIDAKCTTTTPLVADLIAKFLELPIPKKDDPEAATRSEERESMLLEIRGLIRELMPCLEEKMHVAGVAAEAVTRHINRIDRDYDIITSREIPEVVQYGHPDHPAIIVDAKPVDHKSVQSQRSESRREAIAAKKAAAAAAAAEKGTGSGSGRGRGSTPDVKKKVSGKKVTGNGTPAAEKRSAEAAGGAGGASGASSASSSTTTSGPSKRRKVAKPGVIAQNGLPQVASAAATAAAVSRNAKSPSSDEKDSGSTRPSRVVNKSRKGQEAAAAEAAEAAAKEEEEEDEDGAEPVYCYCEQVSYGEMVACDGAQCTREWFHLPCLGLSSPPKGNWYCDECKAGRKR